MARGELWVEQRRCRRSEGACLSINGGEIRFSIFHASSSTLVYPNELHRDLGHQRINEGGFPSCVKGQGYEFEFKIFPKAHDLKNV